MAPRDPLVKAGLKLLIDNVNDFNDKLFETSNSPTKALKLNVGDAGHIVVFTKEGYTPGSPLTKTLKLITYSISIRLGNDKVAPTLYLYVTNPVDDNLDINRQTAKIGLTHLHKTDVTVQQSSPDTSEVTQL